MKIQIKSIYGSIIFEYEKEIGQPQTVNAEGLPVDYAFYTDTDSCFISALPLIKFRNPDADYTDEQFMIDQTNGIADEVQKHINMLYGQYAKVFLNTDKHRFQIKQEYVAKSGLWIAKKRYAQWVIYKEGKPTDKLDIKGMDVVRSSFPEDFKKIMKEVLWFILKEKNKSDTSDLIMNFKNKISQSEVVNLMKNSGVKEISKFVKGRTSLSGYTKGTPVHVKSAINYNDLLKQFKMIKRMGSVSKIMGFIPGMGQLKNAASQVDDKQFEQMGVLIHSMTDEERKDPKLIDMSSKRRDRVARGSGMKVADLNRLRQALETQKKMMKKMMSMDEKELEGLSKNPSKMMQPTKTKKGKGKGKGQFRIR